MRPSPFVLVVPEEAAGARLDRFVVSALTGASNAPSRSELQRWIEHGRVTVEGVRKRAADKVTVGATIVIEPEPPAQTRAIAESGIEFDVLYTDADVVVVNKPAGLVVHPAKGHPSGTLVNGLLALGLFDRALYDAGEVAAEEDVSSSPDATATHVRPGIVHRLDKGTSGVMVVARSLAAHAALKVQFQQHTIDREYEAICVGAIKGRTFDTLHGRHPRDRMKFTGKVKEGKRAITHVDVLEDLGIASHVRCRLETGRTHQIRMHLAEAGHAVLGDPLYGKPPKNDALRIIATGMGHQALHARLLAFDHPSRAERMTFTSPPPTDFMIALATLRSMPE
jgi:23S rRNA pseudouridine1911/1915/1917 synthase